MIMNKAKNKNELKGWFGEKMTGVAISIALDETIYRSSHDVIIKSNAGTTQINHVIISTYGIFVIETKNKKGWIFGSKGDAKWTQCLRGGKKYTFQNPLRQNYRHTKSISKFLDLPHCYMHSIVLFMGECEIKTEMPRNVLVSGTRSSTRIELIRDYIENFKKVILSDEQIQDAVTKISALKYNKSLSVQSHVKSVKKRFGKPRPGKSKFGETRKKTRTRKSWCLGSEFPGSDELWIKYRQ